MAHVTRVALPSVVGRGPPALVCGPEARVLHAAIVSDVLFGEATPPDGS